MISTIAHVTLAIYAALLAVGGVVGFGVEEGSQAGPTLRSHLHKELGTPNT